MESVRLRLYRKLGRLCFERWVLPRFFSPQRRVKAFSPEIVSQVFPSFPESSSPRVPRGWFHAASAGELESLSPLISDWTDLGHEAIITVFSESTPQILTQIKQALDTKLGKIGFIGYSPWEGCWRETLANAKPDFFLTAKYEAWPDLWASLASCGVPLWIAGARSRRSLTAVKWICKLLGADFPALHFLAPSQGDCLPLQRQFPQASVFVTGEPRWDQVSRKLRMGNLRVQELIQAFSSWKRPWAILGSIWKTDLVFWKDKLRLISGTIWLVPRRVNAQSIAEIESLLRGEGFHVVKTSLLQRSRNETCSDRNGQNPSCILVDEVGVLSELYTAADWAYIGGGFGAGVHSTIEPAISGLPVACGPKRANLFPEIQELVESLQLTVLSEPTEIEPWLNRIETLKREYHSRWLQGVQSRLGAAQNILKILSETIQRKDSQSPG